MTILITPAFVIYAKFRGIQHLVDAPWKLQHTLGNMGFNAAFCNSIYIRKQMAKPSHIECEVGLIDEIWFAGILPTGTRY